MTAKSLRKGAGAFGLLSFVLLMVFFVGMALIDGPEYCVDTTSYVTMDFSREPVYPLFLLGLRTLFEKMGVTVEPYGLPAYFTAAVILQSILWAFAIYRLGIYIYDVCKDSLTEFRARAMMVIAEGFQVGVACLNRFVAKRGSMYSESLMTESLAMPLFVLFTVLLLKSFEDYDLSSCIKLFLLATLIGSVRKQMLVAVLMWGCCSFILHLFVKRHRSLNKFSYTVIFVVLTFVAVAMLDRGYNLAARGLFVGHTGNSKGGLCTLLYTSDLSDAKLFAEDKDYPELGALFTKIMEECRSRELTIDYAPGYDSEVKNTLLNSDWAEMASHYADSYDIIGFDIVQPMCDEYVAMHYPELDRPLSLLQEDKIEKKLFNTLLKGHVSGAFKGGEKDMLYVLEANVLKAFVISNANITPCVLIKVSLIIYGVYLVLYIFFAIMTLRLAGTVSRGQDLEHFNTMRKILLLGFVVMAGLSVNAVVTGALIFPQPRYMCYSMGLFYLSLCSLVMVRR